MSSGQLSMLLRHIRQWAGGSMTRDLPDQQLLDHFVRQREEAAFALLVERHGPMVLRVCQRVLGNYHAAEDAFQATFLVLVRKARTIGRRELLGNWLYGVAYRTAARTKVEAAKRQHHEMQAQPRPSVDPLAEVTGRELCAVLDEELNRLPERYRGPFRLCYLEGQTRDQAARQLGWPLRTLQRRLERGRQLLQARLTRHGLSLSAALLTMGLAQQAGSAALTAHLVASTAQAATRFAADSGVIGKAVSGEVAGLVEGVLNSMAVAKLKFVTALLLAVTLAIAGAGAWTHYVLAAKPRPGGQEEKPRRANRRTNPPKLEPAREARTDLYGDSLPAGAIARIGTLRLWHGSQFYALAYAPNGKTVAACANDSIIRLWDTVTGKQIWKCQGLKGGVSSLAFSPDSKLLAAAGWSDSPIWLLDAASGKEIRRLPGAKGGTYGLAYAPDGKHLAAATGDQVIHIWETDKWREVRQCLGNRGRGAFCLWALAFFPDGKTLVSGNQEDGTIRLCDVGTGQQVRLVVEKLKGLWSMALSPDGKKLATIEVRKTLRLWDTATGKEISRYTGPEGSCYCIAFSPDSRTIASAGGKEREVHLWDTATGKERQRWGLGALEFASRLAFSPDGKVLAVGASGGIRFREVATGRDVLPFTGPSDWVTTIGFVADGKTVIVATWDGKISLWEATTGKEASPPWSPPNSYAPLSPLVQLMRPALSHDGRTVASIDAQRAVWVWDAATGKLVSKFGGAHCVLFTVALSPDGKIAAVPDPNKKVGLWEAATGKLIRRLDPQREPVNYCSFSADGKILAITYLDSSIGLWDIATGKELRQLRWPGSVAQCLAFSPDGKVLASGHSGYVEVPHEGKEEETLVRLWDVGTGRQFRQLKGGANRTISSVTFSPDGKTLAAGTHSLIYLWEVTSGKERGRFEGHGADVMGLAFSPQAWLLASGSGDHTALVWDVTGLHQDGGLRALNSSLAQIESLWDDLASAQAPRAYQAMWKLTASGKQTVAFLNERLRPVSTAEYLRFAQLVSELDSDRFALRKRATAELERLGVLAEAALVEAMTKKPSLEVRQRVELLLGKLKEGGGNAEDLRVLRAIEVLEQIGSPEARGLLRTLAKGAREARLTQEAKAALERLANGATSPR